MSSFRLQSWISDKNFIFNQIRKREIFSFISGLVETGTMKLAAIFFALLASAVAEDPSEFIIGGNDAHLGQFRYMASIRFAPSLNHGCGAGILSKNWAITVSLSRLKNSLATILSFLGSPLHPLGQ